MTSATITTQVDEFNVGFAEQVGPRLAAVFAAEQSDLVSGGVPAAAVTVGATLPDAPLLDPTGASTALYSALGSAPAVIVFYRGAWCPYCNITLKHYQDELLPRLRERGVGLVAISPQTPAGSDAAIANGSLEFTVLSDPANALASSLGILTEPSAEARSAHTELGFDVADSNADATGAIPHPTVLVVGADRVVRFADVQVDYTRRTEVADILVAVSALD
jgi:peroxiredoxin